MYFISYNTALHNIQHKIYIILCRYRLIYKFSDIFRSISLLQSLFSLPQRQAPAKLNQTTPYQGVFILQNNISLHSDFPYIFSLYRLNISSICRSHTLPAEKRLKIAVAIRNPLLRNLLILRGFSGILNLIFFCSPHQLSPFFRGPDVEVNLETYQSGHNENDSKPWSTSRSLHAKIPNLPELSGILNLIFFFVLSTGSPRFPKA